MAEAGRDRKRRRSDVNRLAFTLFVTVLATHYGYPSLADLSGGGIAAERAWFYVLRGVEGIVAFLAILALLPRSPLTLAAQGVCVWGAIEEGQTAVCRLAIGINNKQSNHEMQGLCDVVTGWPIYAISLLGLAWWAIRISTKGRK